MIIVDKLIIIAMIIYLVIFFREPVVDFVSGFYEQLRATYTPQQLLVAGCVLLIIVLLALVLPRFDPLYKIKKAYSQWKSKGESTDEKENQQIVG